MNAKVSRTCFTLATLSVTMLLMGATLLAQASEADKTFRPIQPGNELLQEKLPATPLVFSAYAVVWIVVVVYVLTLWRRIAKAELEITRIATRIEGRP
ncbi:MAG: CcmD family protein [Vicinamibacterales bacterium]